MIARTKFFLGTAVGILSATAAFGVQVTMPETFPQERYQKLFERSPFAVATPPVPTPDVNVNAWATNLYVAGIAKMRFEDGSEKDRVTVKNRGNEPAFLLFGNEPNSEGIALVSVDWSERAGKSKVTIKKGTEFATLEFDQAAAAQQQINVPPPMQNGGGRPVQGMNGGRPPGMPANATIINPGGPGAPNANFNRGQPSMNQRPPNLPNGGIPRPSMPAVVNQPQAKSGGAPGTNMGNVGNPDTRRRIRVIPAQPLSQ